MPTTTKVVAKIVVFNQDGNVLLLRRSQTDKRRPGKQDFPGGGVELHEGFTAAVCREADEEAGLQLRQTEVELFYSRTEMTPHGNVVRLLFWTRVPNQPIRLSNEHDEYRWVAPDQVAELFDHPVYSKGFMYGINNKLYQG